MAESSSSLYADVMVSAPEIPLITRCINGQHASWQSYGLLPNSGTAIAPVPGCNGMLIHRQSPGNPGDFSESLCVFPWMPSDPIHPPSIPSRRSPRSDDGLAPAATLSRLRNLSGSPSARVQSGGQNYSNQQVISRVTSHCDSKASQQKHRCKKHPGCRTKRKRE